MDSKKALESIQTKTAYSYGKCLSLASSANTEHN